MAKIKCSKCKTKTSNDKHCDECLAKMKAEKVVRMENLEKLSPEDRLKFNIYVANWDTKITTFNFHSKLMLEAMKSTSNNEIYEMEKKFGISRNDIPTLKKEVVA